MMMVKSRIMLGKNFAVCTHIIILTHNAGCRKFILHFPGLYLYVAQAVSSNIPKKSEGSERAGLLWMIELCSPVS